MDPAASEPIRPLTNFTPQDDPSKFIRTYAKDFAAVSGQPLPAAAPLPPVEAEKKAAEESGVSLPEYDLSPVNHAEPASPKEFPQEEVDLKASDSDGIFKGQPDLKAAPISSMSMMPQGSIAPAPMVQPTEMPAEPEPDREAILARLRAKVAAERTVEATAPVVAEPAIRTAAPDFEKIPEPVLPIPQISKEPLPAPVRPAPAPEAPSPIHTYSSDFADHIDTSGSNTFAVLAAQSDAGQTPKPAPRKRNLAPLFAGAAMLIIGVGAIAGAYLFTRSGSIAPAVASVPSLIPFDESVEVKGTGQDLMQAISNVAQGGSVQGNVVVTYVTLSTTTGSGIPQPGGALIEQMGLQAPSILLRNIDNSSTVGVVRAGTESRPFMILKVNSYERTFAGMLAWEPTMANDLATFYPAYASALPLSTSTATSTASSSSPQIQMPAPTTFTDAVVDNYDVRVLRDSSGRSLMLYGYRGKDTLIIARDEAAFTELVSRLTGAGN